jgi:hypothetical protein
MTTSKGSPRKRRLVATIKDRKSWSSFDLQPEAPANTRILAVART